MKKLNKKICILGQGEQVLISHRGNLNGKNKDRENSPDYIKEALD